MSPSLPESVVLGAATVDLPSWLVIGAAFVLIGLVVAVVWRLSGRITRVKAAGTSIEFGDLAEKPE